MQEKLIKAISKYTSVTPPYPAQKSLKADLGINSLAIVELILNLEEAFGIEFDLDEMGNLTTVGDLIAMVESSSPSKTILQDC